MQSKRTLYFLVVVFMNVILGLETQAAINGSGAKEQISDNQNRIEFTYIPPYGYAAYLKGRTYGIDTSKYYVAVYLNKSGWYSKFNKSQQKIKISKKGDWLCDLSNTAKDFYADKIIAFLLPKNVDPYLAKGEAELPEKLYQYDYTEIGRDYSKRIVKFSGFEWYVKESDILVGPGENYFSGDEKDVYVDGKGDLHLNIVKRDSKWYSTEIVNTMALGYGKYVLTIKSRVDVIDKNTILGFFTWDGSAKWDDYREIDFEFSRWGSNKKVNSQFVIQPYAKMGNMVRYETNYPKGENLTTHVFEWKEDGVYFESYYGEYTETPSKENMIALWNYSGKDMHRPGAENIRINLWLRKVDGRKVYKEGEIVIKDFKFISPKS